MEFTELTGTAGIFIGFLFGFAVAVWVIALYMRYKINQHMGSFDAVLEELATEVQKIVDDIVKVNVEKHGHVYYCYNADTHEFVCQGENVDELESKFKLMNPEGVMCIVGGDRSAIDELKKQRNYNDEQAK